MRSGNMESVVDSYKDDKYRLIDKITLRIYKMGMFLIGVSAGHGIKEMILAFQAIF